MASRPSVPGHDLDLFHFGHSAGRADIGHDRQSIEIGDNLAQKFESFGAQIGLLDRQTGDVAARTRKAFNDAVADRISCGRKHDRDDRGCLFCRNSRRRSRCDNDVDLEPDELGGDLSIAFVAPLRPSIFDRDGTALNPAEIPQKRLPIGSRSKAFPSPRNRRSAASSAAARPPRAATPPPRR